MIPEDLPCQKHCTSLEHGNIITSALTKRSVSDSSLCAYINNVCHLCESSKDIQGRKALHMAASCGRTEVCKWLLCKHNSKIDDKDAESGYTALHRSIFYGKIHTAVTLIKLGANINIMDNNDLTPLEHAMKDNLITDKAITNQLIHVWGSNSNYTLGPLQSRNTPEILDSFHKKYPKASVKQICLEKFHCVIITMDGDVYSYGHGQGGRLGLGSEITVLDPTLVRLSSRGMTSPICCKQAAIARDHSIFLTESGHVWTCGLNNNFVLGIEPPPPQLLVPRPLRSFKCEISGICCGRFHSVAWGPTGIYTWGLNAGQLGHDKTNEAHVISPKLVTTITGMDVQFIAVAASNGATAIATSRGDIYVLHEFQCRKIASREYNIISLDIIGGKLAVDNSQIDPHYELRVIVLIKNGNILIWQESDQHLLRCILSLNRCIQIKQVILNVTGITFLTNDKEVFKGKIKSRKRKYIESKEKGKQFHQYLDKSECVMVIVEKVAKLHGAVFIECDLEGQNYAALLQNTMAYIRKIPEISPSTISADVDNLLVISDESDTLHDVIFKVKNQRFPAHKYIIANSSEKLTKLIKASSSNLVEIENMEPELFEQILKYIYVGHCDLTQYGRCPGKIIKLCQNDAEKTIDKSEVLDSTKSAFEVYSKKNKIVKNTSDKKHMDPIRLLQEAAKKLGVISLQKDLDNFSYQNEMIIIKGGKRFLPRIIRYDFDKFTEYYDVSIQSKNGRVIDAHKCVLAARAEYFNNMFSNRWNETNSKSELSLPYPQNLLTHLIHFLYTDEVFNLELEDIDTISNLLVLADQFIILRLCEICEYTLSTLITLKNVIKIIQLAHLYNAAQLKIVCMEYICLNLAAVLESRGLETVDEDILLHLTDFYSIWNSNMCQRVITPFSDAICDEIVIEIGELHPVDFHIDGTPEKNKIIPKTSQRKRHRTHKVSVLEKTEPQPENTIVRELFSPEEKELIKTEKTIPSRILAINLAHEKLQAKEDEIEFVRLSSQFSKASMRDSMGGSKSFTDDFPGGSPDGHLKSAHKFERVDKHKMVKVSQKQRKRLSSENSQPESNQILSESPKNPWKLLEPISPVGSNDLKINMNKIITEEKKQKENLVKIKSKLLVFTQMEDKALEELGKFYNVENVFDEVIIPQRVEIGLIAPPVWVQKPKS